MFGTYRNKLEQLKGRKDSATKRVESLNIEFKDMRALLDRRIQAQAFIQEVALRTQEQLKVSIEPLVTSTIQKVTGENISFEMDIVTRRNAIECDLYFVKNGSRLVPKDSTGYGYINIASLALKVVLWSLQRPRSAPVFILDEEFRDLSDAYQIAAGQMVSELSEQLGIQFILITHEPPLTEYADKKFRISQKVNRTLGFPESLIEILS